MAVNRFGIHAGLWGFAENVVLWTQFAQALSVADDSGPITVETFSSAIITDADAADIGLWRPMWADPSHVAADSLAFIRDQFAIAAASALSV